MTTPPPAEGRIAGRGVEVLVETGGLLLLEPIAESGSTVLQVAGGTMTVTVTVTVIGIGIAEALVWSAIIVDVAEAAKGREMAVPRRTQRTVEVIGATPTGTRRITRTGYLTSQLRDKWILLLSRVTRLRAIGSAPRPSALPERTPPLARASCSPLTRTTRIPLRWRWTTRFSTTCLLSA
jgi:hypothetical protein